MRFMKICVRPMWSDDLYADLQLTSGWYADNLYSDNQPSDNPCTGGGGRLAAGNHISKFTIKNYLMSKLIIFLKRGYFCQGVNIKKVMSREIFFFFFTLDAFFT